jgi:regulator of PEP synthase PpsR (kinase-PPPase family)
MRLVILAVSDASGETAERVVQSALVQFHDAPATVVRRGGVRTSRALRAVVREAAGRHAIIVHTLVSDGLRRLMLAECRARGVDALDLMGPVLDRLATHLKVKPREKPGLFRQLVEARSREIEAVDFAFRHDDGQNADGLRRAEVVLVGVSRTMKTPTALYLAYRGWFAANVPLVPGVPPPPELLAVPARRVIALTISPARLRELRLARADHLGVPAEAYTSLARIREELRYAQNLAASHRWRQVDVTSKSVEEVAREVALLLPAEGVSMQAGSR